MQVVIKENLPKLFYIKKGLTKKFEWTHKFEKKKKLKWVWLLVEAQRDSQTLEYTIMSLLCRKVHENLHLDNKDKGP